MPTTTAAQHPPRADAARLLTAAAGIAAFAAAEVPLGIYAGPFWPSFRAEALPLVAFRPWLLVAAAMLVSRWPVAWRAAAYAAGLAVATVNDGLFLIRLGNPSPWAELLRIGAASALFLLVADVMVQLGRRRFGRGGLLAAGGVLALFLIIPSVRAPYERFVGQSEPRQAAQKPELVLMTALPIIWGEGGAFDPNSKPAGAYRALQEEFNVRIVDTLEPGTLGRSRLLLLAQPGWLRPEELVAVDEWVRRGGRALVLADPELDWPSELPLGDIRRPPPASLLHPLLNHWGLDLRESGRKHGSSLSNGRHLRTERPGVLAVTKRECRIIRSDLARCELDAGRVFVVPDADLMRDELWMAPGRDGGERHRRLADNPLILADLLDELADVRRQRAEAPVVWRRPSELPIRSIAKAVVPLLLLVALAAGAALWTRRRRRTTMLSTSPGSANGGGT
jgi:hypothetical protein